MLSANTLMTDRRYVEGDAFMDAIEPLLPDAFRLANAMLRSRAEAMDAVQDASVNARIHRAAFRPQAGMRPWFLAIVANQCRQAVRQRWWSVIRRPQILVARSSGEASIDEADSLRQGLRQLSHADRLVLVLRYYLDLPLTDVAETLDISPGAARIRVHRALQRLRPILGTPEGATDE